MLAALINQVRTTPPLRASRTQRAIQPLHSRTQLPVLQRRNGVLDDQERRQRGQRILGRLGMPWRAVVTG